MIWKISHYNPFFRIIFCSKLTGLPLPPLDLSSVTPAMVAVTLSAGPVILAQTMANFTDKTKRSIFYPFHKVRNRETLQRTDLTLPITGWLEGYQWSPACLCRGLCPSGQLLSLLIIVMMVSYSTFIKPIDWVTPH